MRKLEVGDKVKISWGATVLAVKRRGIRVRLDDTGEEAWVPFDTSKEVG